MLEYIVGLVLIGVIAGLLIIIKKVDTCNRELRMFADKFDRANFTEKIITRALKTKGSELNATNLNIPVTRYGVTVLDFTCASHSIAERTLTLLTNKLTTIGYASIADLYRILDVYSSTHVYSYVECNNGWTDLSRARLINICDGWKIELPDPKPLFK